MDKRKHYVQYTPQETFHLEHELLLPQTATQSNFSDEVLRVTTLRIDDQGDSTIHRLDLLRYYLSNINIVTNSKTCWQEIYYPLSTVTLRTFSIENH